MTATLSFAMFVICVCGVLLTLAIEVWERVR